MSDSELTTADTQFAAAASSGNTAEEPVANKSTENGAMEDSIRKSTRIKKLTSAAKQNKCMDLNVALTRLVNQNQHALEGIYSNFKQLSTVDVLAETLGSIEEQAKSAIDIFDELYILSDNKVDHTTMQKYDEYLKEVEMLGSEIKSKSSYIQEEATLAEEDTAEIQKMEESMARMREELEEQNRIYEEAKKKRAQIRLQAFSRSHSVSSVVSTPLHTATQPQQSGIATPRSNSAHETPAAESPTPNRFGNLTNERTSQQREPPDISIQNHNIAASYRVRTPVHTETGDIHSLDAVKELSQSIVMAMKSTKRSYPEPAIYDGNPIDFQDWELDLDAYIESECLVGKEPLRHLKKFVAGRAKDAISGHFITNTEQAYRDARKELKERFGSKHNVNRALRKRLENWSRVGSKDPTSLRKYADFLCHIRSAMIDIPELQSLNHSQENEKLAAKLPDWMIRNWARKVKDRRHADHSYPTFREFADFVVDQAEVMDEPLMKLGGHGDKESNPKKPKSVPTQVRTYATGAITAAEACKCCGKMHRTTECFTLAKKTEEEKEKFVREIQACFGCLQNGHRSKQCPDRATCKKCSKRHPTALHRESRDWRNKKTGELSEKKEVVQARQEIERDEAPSKPETASKEPKKLTTKSTHTDGKILSMIVPVHVSTTDEPHKERLVYALLDTQSDASYITKDTAGYLNPQCSEELVTIDTLVGDSTAKINKYQNLRIRGYEQRESTSLEAYEWSNLTCSRDQIPNQVNVSQYPHLKNHAHKLPPPLDIPVGMLIGGNCPEAFAPLETVVNGKGLPYARKSMLGWTVFGGTNSQVCNSKGTAVEARANCTLLKLNQLESSTMISQDDIQFMNIMDKGTQVLENGSYQMPLPYKERPILPNNRVQVEKRLAGLVKKFKTNKDFKEKYEAFMGELISNGHAEEVTGKEISPGEGWYIPHFAVTHPKKKKIRVVFDCSAMYANTSLNQHLLQGPDFLNSLLGILCRFRKEPVAIACDIEKMYYNFFVNEEDRDFLRFLWPDEDGRVKEYRMTVHLFGATSSPAVATYGLRTLAEKHRHNLPIAADFIKRDFYVDDGITSVENARKAKELIKDARELCSKGNLRLHKFVSNDPSVLATVPESERIVGLDLFQENLPTQRTLGLEWALDSDTLRFNGNTVSDKPLTRRGMLSVVSQLFDPLGLLAPFTLTGKNILQKVNQAGGTWDEPVTTEIDKPWRDWVGELPGLDTLCIDRCIKPPNFGKVVRTELHHFSDASLDGIGACSYVRVVNEQGDSQVTLMLGKSKVVPSKGVFTVPRLELQGAVMATQLSETLCNELDMVIDAEHFWTDSTIVLGYLANESKRFNVYVANRVQEILQRTNIKQWHHVPGENNPADIASRGMSSTKLQSSMWFTGPEFLLDSSELNKNLERDHTINRVLQDDDPEVKKVKMVKVTSLTQNRDIYDKLKKYGSFKGLVTSIAYLKQMAAKKSWKSLQEPNVAELEEAKKTVIKITQLRHFHLEIQKLSAGDELSSTSSILPLNPYLDRDGLLRVGGRAKKKAPIDENIKNPLVLPKNCHVARLIALDTHGRSHHLGRSYTLTAMRQKGYWTIAGARLVKDIVSNCIVCKKHRGRPSQQQMGELPDDRLQRTPPFTMVGIDCFGPFMVKERRSNIKRYGLLFTCFYSRAIHIELVDDLTTDSFINAMRCFIAIRGNVKKIYSDHGTNFVGGRNEMKKEYDRISCEETRRYLRDKQIEFIMTTPTASHQGGVWERQIRTIRAVLSDVLTRHQGRIDTACLRTMFYEVATLVNDRPLSVLDLNNHEEIPLTPNMLLTEKTGATPPLPPGEFDASEVYCKQRWRRVQALADEFWQKWKVQYLDNILKRQKWEKPKENIKTGDVVLVVETDAPRNLWKTGVVEEVQPGDDGCVRKATVRLANRNLDKKGRVMEIATVLQRPVQKLVKLM